MTSRPAATIAVLLLLLLIVLSGLWLSRRLLRSLPAAPTALPTQTCTLTPPPLPSPTPLQAPPGYRLAGTALRFNDPFAVIEAPNGSHGLYRLDDEVPGLGRLLRIDAERAVIRSDRGDFSLWVAPAATPTPTLTRRPVTPTLRSTPGASLKRTLAPTAARVRTVGESTPSSAPDQPAS